MAYERRWEESEAAFAKALELDPNHADTWAAMSDMSVLDGRVADGLAQIETALRSIPIRPAGIFVILGRRNTPRATMRRQPLHSAGKTRIVPTHANSWLLHLRSWASVRRRGEKQNCS